MTIMAIIERFIPGRRRNRWAAELKDAGLSLRELAGRTESEFLSIGGNLQGFHQRAGEITDLASGIARTASAEGTGAASVELQRLLDRMEAYLSRSGEDTSRVAVILGEIKELLGKVEEPLEGFRKVIRILRIQGISTRIESARLTGEDGGGFDTVADHVEKLARMVEEKIMALSDQKAALDTLISTRLAAVRNLRTRQQGQSQAILAETRKSIEFLATAHDNCSGASGAVASRAEGVSRNIAEVVMSMQFHDITRQQIEHVTEAIEELLPENNPKRGFDGAAGLCALQSAHLSHAREALLSAVGRIRENLRGISRNVADLSGDAKKMSGVLDRAGHSFLSDLEDELGRVTGSLGEAADASRELSEVMLVVSGTVGDMMGFVDEVERFGSEIELIALNASIKATRSGTRVDALRVLAESIQMLSKDAHRHAGAVSKGLRAIFEQTDRLKSGTGAASGGQPDGGSGEVEEIRAALSAVMCDLHGVNEQLGSSLTRLDDATAALSADIEASVIGITAHEIVDELIGGVLETLGRIAGQAGSTLSKRGGASSDDRFDELEQRYTMEQEREVHRAISGKAAMPGPKAPSPAAADPEIFQETPPAESGDSLGDNVELF